VRVLEANINDSFGPKKDTNLEKINQLIQILKESKVKNEQLLTERA